MRVFVAGATGAIGTQLVPQLAAAGHDVIAMTRSPARTDMLRALGARPVVADALDPDTVAWAVAETEPEVIVHQLTALKGEPGLREMRHPDRFAAATNRLRTEGTDHLLAAGRAVGIRRFIAQSVVALGTDARTGGPVKTEDDPLDLDLPAKGRSGADAVRYLEDAVGASRGRGPRAAPWGLRRAGHQPQRRSRGLGDQGHREAAAPDHRRRRRRCLVVGAHRGRGQRHRGGPRPRRVRQRQRRRDEPAPVGEWLPFLAEQLGANQPMRVPPLVARLLAGEAPVWVMTQVRGASNAKAKRELGWPPRWSSWRGGFAKGLGE